MANRSVVLVVEDPVLVALVVDVAYSDIFMEFHPIKLLVSLAAINIFSLLPFMAIKLLLLMVVSGLYLVVL